MLEMAPRIHTLAWDGNNETDIMDMVSAWYALSPGELVIIEGNGFKAVVPGENSGVLMYLYLYNIGDTVVCTPWGTSAFTAENAARFYQ